MDLSTFTISRRVHGKSAYMPLKFAQKFVDGMFQEIFNTKYTSKYLLKGITKSIFYEFVMKFN